MILTKERVGEIAMIILQHKMEEEGEIRLNPKEVKRQIMNGAKKIGITPQEGAEFIKIVLKTAFDKTIAEIESISSSAKVEEKEKVLDRIRIPA